MSTTMVNIIFDNIRLPNCQKLIVRQCARKNLTWKKIFDLLSYETKVDASHFMLEIDNKKVKGSDIGRGVPCALAMLLSSSAEFIVFHVQYLPIFVL